MHRAAVLMTGAIVCLLLSGCSGKNEKDLLLYRAMEDGISNSNRLVNRSTETICQVLGEKMRDPATSYRAEIWYPKATLIRKLSLDMLNYVDEMETQLKKEDGWKNNNKKELVGSIIKYWQALSTIDSGMTIAFASTIHLDSVTVELSDRKIVLTDLLFEDMPVAATMALLARLRQEIIGVENRMVQFCLNKVPNNSWCEFYSGIVAQNSTYVKPGEKMEITTGIGNFIIRPEPVTIINNDTIPVSGDGIARYFFKASRKPGNHSLQVRISFIDEMGKNQVIEKDVIYTVADTTQN